MAKRRYRKRSVAVLVMLVATIVLIVVYADDLRRFVIFDAGLDDAAPTIETMRESVLRSSDPTAALVAMWQSGTLPHQGFAISWLRERGADLGTDWPAVRATVAEAAASVDCDVVVDALQLMSIYRDGGALGHAPHGLLDADPRVRVAWIQYLASVGGADEVRLLAPRLRDEDARVAATAASVLERWTEQPIAFASGATVERRGPAAARFEAWLDAQGERFPRPSITGGPRALPPRITPAVLIDTEDEPVAIEASPNLTTLVHFFTTRCAECSAMLPSLAEFERLHADRVRVIHVNTDMVAEAHPFDPTRPSVVSVDLSDLPRGLLAGTGLDPIERGVAIDLSRRLASEHHIESAITLDDSGELTAIYRAQAQPTCVWIDRQGAIRRRFSGPREPETLTRMLDQIHPREGLDGAAAPADATRGADELDLLSPLPPLEPRP